ncbi:MAG: hypothetical protein JWN45_200 [Acidobacteriaceae bacterium]|nr:hypothetical protein [Acidobacteriaceae bacterium]
MATQVEVFETTIQKTNSLLKDIDAEMGWGDRRKQAYAGLRAVLHALRDRLPVTEAANFAAQLPMLVRGFYFEGWKPESVPKKMHREEFLEAISQQFPFAVKGGIKALVNGMMRALAKHIDPRALDDIREELPNDIADLF